MSKNHPLVTIKGKKDGLILQLDDQCSYTDLIQELKQKLSARNQAYSDGPLISVKVVTGNRYLTKPQQEEIQSLIRAEKSLFVAEVESNVITKEESEALLKNQQLTPLIKMIRSGQVLEVTGDLLLIGDVNSGAKVTATGNIYILGVLRGVAHAGLGGYRDKIIAASVMKPSQLIIGDIMNRSPEEPEESNFDPNRGDHLMESAFVDPETEQIVIDRLNTLFRRSKVEN
ncbi:septum site-determining protein MinC [Pullulanibacillus sp. KACC 23026]|uniref:septum site-determining protein MinC n=1 Tax=Pullulanibacillus sp. KACC 23026 TaxID=3028315 RepID=UPI0023AF41E5|nr:septum site-determining protein MinC [Pullulanibacillus sp. KACC 23026]WEG14053.1 septum site-determining protein MinC [Pullulanibacillus sp. KACC 23026]